jgi:RNA polymerase sigma factor (sigma-70 family)
MALTSPRQLPRRLTGVALPLLSDEQLARLAGAGEPRAFAVIFERHHQALYRYCMSLLRDPEEAGDALQNTMLKALRNLTGSREKRGVPLRPWLFRIAHNEAISLVRRRRPHEELTDASVPAAPGADATADMRAKFDDVVADLRALTEMQRSALVLRELSGFDYEDIGTVLGASPEAAREKVHDARMAMRARAEGRDLDCTSIRSVISDGDRRTLRRRTVKAHLAACAGCRDFEQTIVSLPRALGALAPPLPIAAAHAIAEEVFRRGGIEAGAAALLGGAGAAGKLGGAGAVGKLFAASSLTKPAAVAAVALTAGTAVTGTAVVTRADGERPAAEVAQHVGDAGGSAQDPGGGPAPTGGERSGGDGESGGSRAGGEGGSREEGGRAEDSGRDSQGGPAGGSSGGDPGGSGHRPGSPSDPAGSGPTSGGGSPSGGPGGPGGGPGVPNPGVPTPQVELPPVNVPPVSVPEVKVPPVTVPQVNDPPVNLPPVNLPNVNAPAPGVNLPGG